MFQLNPQEKLDSVYISYTDQSYTYISNIGQIFWAKKCLEFRRYAPNAPLCFGLFKMAKQLASQKISISNHLWNSHSFPIGDQSLNEFWFGINILHLQKRVFLLLHFNDISKTFLSWVWLGGLYIFCMQTIPQLISFIKVFMTLGSTLKLLFFIFTFVFLVLCESIFSWSMSWWLLVPLVSLSPSRSSSLASLPCSLCPALLCGRGLWVFPCWAPSSKHFLQLRESRADVLLPPAILSKTSLGQCSFEGGGWDSSRGSTRSDPPSGILTGPFSSISVLLYFCTSPLLCFCSSTALAI